MSGLSGVGRGIGAALGGFNQAIDRQRRMGLEDADANWQQQTRQRQQQQWALQDKDMQDMQAAQAAASQVVEQERAAHDAQQAMPPPGPTLDGAAVPRTPQPYQPSKKTLLKAAQAEYDELFKRGRSDIGVKAYAKAEGLRSQFRQESGARALQALQTGGDFISPLREFDDDMDDGLDMVEAKEIKGPKGERAFEIRQKRRITGEDMPPMTVSASDMEMMISKSMASGPEIAKFNLQSYFENLKANNRQADIEARGDKTLEAIDRRNEGAVGVAKQRGKDAKDVARIRVSGTVTAAQIRKSGGGGLSGGAGSNNVHSVKTNNDGTRTMIFKDGTAKTLVDSASGKPLIGMEAEQALQSLTTQIGKTIDGSLATPEANRARADSMLPKPAAPAAAPNRLRLDAQGNLIGP